METDEESLRDLYRRMPHRARPDPSLGADDVIAIQLAALRANDVPNPDTGILVAFRFTSPENRAAVGPLSRFLRLMHNPLHAPLLQFAFAERGELTEVEDLAQQWVTVHTPEGEAVTYRFTLMRQIAGAYPGCWMTDSVIREREAPDAPAFPLR